MPFRHKNVCQEPGLLVTSLMLGGKLYIREAALRAMDVLMYKPKQYTYSKFVQENNKFKLKQKKSKYQKAT